MSDTPCAAGSCPTRGRWQALWQALGLTEPAGVFTELLARYGEAHRHYHTAQHLNECLKAFDTLKAMCDHPAEAELALWFHDAVYDTRRHDNELLSADWAAKVLEDAGAVSEVTQRARDLIAATSHRDMPFSADAKAVVDADLSILAAGRARFDQFEDQVRQEYDWVPKARYRERRAEIMGSLLARPSIYSTPLFRQTREAQARANIAELLKTLRF